MEIELFGKAITDFQYWKETGNKSVQKKIQTLFTSMEQSPFEGIGKPEALKHNLSGFWSRRISGEHRIIYEVTDVLIKVHSLRGHY